MVFNFLIRAMDSCPWPELSSYLGPMRTYPAAPGRKSGAARIKREAAKRRNRRG